ncbi:MAG: ribonuclease HI [Treponema sp.]|jgi:ribonuclease HI|nr:ribonuclease HI [Treponema sp.]
MYKIYADGGCSGNPGPGGWAFLILEETEKRRQVVRTVLKEKKGAEEETTNNRMELIAVIRGLETFKRLCLGTAAEVWTDSQYVQKGMTEWVAIWQERDWQNNEGKPVKNQDLWFQLLELAQDLSLEWRWVRGHNGDEYNERCDTLTQRAIASIADDWD